MSVLRRNEVKEWLKLDAREIRPQVAVALTKALASPIATLEASGRRLISQLETAPQELIQVLTRMHDVKKDDS